MKKDFGAKPFMYPLPVLIIATYNEDGSANAMNAAWGGIADFTKISLYLSKEHRTMKNILKRKAFTVSIADVKHVKEADYFGVVSGNKIADKVKKAGLHTTKSRFVDAPIIDEFLMTLECQMISYDEKSEYLVGEICNVCADESILNEQGQIDPMKLQPITFDPVGNTYITLGKAVGKAFGDGIEFSQNKEIL